MARNLTVFLASQEFTSYYTSASHGKGEGKGEGKGDIVCQMYESKILLLHKHLTMGFLDVILGLLLLYGLWKGLKNGLFVEIASIVALVAGIYGAIHFSYYAGDYLSQNMEWEERYINIAAFIITFVVIVIVVHMAGKFLTKIANFAMLGLLNKIAGGIFGALKVAVILGALLIFFERTNASAGLGQNETIRQSVLYEPIKEIGALVFSKVLKGEDNGAVK